MPIPQALRPLPHFSTQRILPSNRAKCCDFICLQAEFVAAGCVQSGTQIVSFGTSEQGLRAVRMTVEFFVFLIELLLSFANFAQVCHFLRKHYKAQLALRKALNRAASVTNAEETKLLVEQEALCNKGISRRTVTLIFQFWLATQGLDQIARHDLGRRSSICFLILYAAALSKLAHSVLCFDTTYWVASKAAISGSRRPFVTGVVPYCVRFNTAEVIKITGRFFGERKEDVLSVFVGDFECTDLQWVSPTEIRCKSPVVDSAELGFDAKADEKDPNPRNRYHCDVAD